MPKLWFKRQQKQHNILLTGPARSGTNLACSLLNQVENVVALQEPINVTELVNLKDFLHMKNYINSFFSDMRISALKKGEVITNNLNGKVLDNYFQTPSDGPGLRHDKAQRGQFVKIGRQVTDEMTMVIKHPAVFTALLPDLIKDFSVFAIVRHPLYVLASWNSLEISHYQGHAPIAEHIDKTLATELDSIPDRIDRQIHLLHWMFEKYMTLDKERIIFYEDIIATSGKALKVIVSEAQSLSAPLTTQNQETRYPNVPIKDLHNRLLMKGGAFFEFYPPKQWTPG